MTALGVDHRLGSDGAPALGTTLVTARHLPDLTESEIGERMQRSFRLAGKRAEIENLSRRVSLAITKRLSPVEKADLKGGNVAGVATSLGINTEQGALLRNIHERTRALQDTALRQNRERVRGNQLDIRR